MSPKRPSSRRASAASTSNPYLRTSATSSTTTIPKEEYTPNALEDITQVNVIASKPGFPSYAQYKGIETAYLKSLSPRRRDRALISQELFDRIWTVLHNPGSYLEDTQFRFWVRRMFTLGNLSMLNIDSDVLARHPSQIVLLHDNLLVATQEQIYDLLCYSHGITNHSGRDRTHASLRKHYTWVPKEIVRQFVKACPTCLIKKCGLSTDMKIKATGDSSSQEQTITLPTLRDFLRDLAARDGIASDSSDTDWHIVKIPSAPRASAVEPPSRDNGPMESMMKEIIPNNQSDLQSLSMSREVSLYQGLPNGWQFHSDYATAHATFVKNKKDPVSANENATGREKRPRIPSIAPMIGAHYGISEENMGSLRKTCNWDRNVAPPGSLQPSQAETLKENRVPQIDPILLALFTSPSNDMIHTPGSSSCSSDVPPPPPLQENNILLNDANAPVGLSSAVTFSRLHRLNLSASIHRAAAPPSLDLESLSSQKSIEAFLAMRDTDGLSPDGSAPCSNESSPSSVRSYSSHMSAFPMTATNSISPANSALPTPLDEVMQYRSDKLAKELAGTTGGISLDPNTVEFT